MLVFSNYIFVISNLLLILLILSFLLQKTARAAAELSTWPDFIEERIVLFDKLMAKYQEEIAAKVYFHVFFFDFLFLINI